MTQKKINNKIYIGADHGGFDLKNSLFAVLKDKYEIHDLGPNVYDPNDDFVDYAIKVAEKVANTKDSFGILICKSGNGMVIAANKVDGAYAALCLSPKHAEMARKDDNANILCLTAEYSDMHHEIVESFLNTSFKGMNTKYGRRYTKITSYEKDRIDFIANSYPRIAVRALILKNNKVLVVKNLNDNTLYLPGGKIEIYETAELALKRELLEETGIDIDVKKIKLLEVIENISASHGKHKIEIIFHCEINIFDEIQGKKDPSHAGMSEFVWLDKNQIKPEIDKGFILKMLSLI